jgi:hypothetical protein
MNRMPPADPVGEPSIQHGRGRLSARPDADAVPPKQARGGRRFRYRLLDLGGAQVGLIERDHALRADDVVIVSSQLGEATWRVVGVLGTCATVTQINQ